MKKIFVDFDRTICPNMDESNPPSDICLETLKLLKEKGHKIIIFSVRSNPLETNLETGHEDMVYYLTKYNVPYDEIDCSKKHYHVIIDDRCVGSPLDHKHNIDWSKVKTILENEDFI